MEKIYTNKKFKRFIGILLAVIMLFNVATPSIITPKSHAVDVGGILLLPLTYLISLLADGAQLIIDEAFEAANIPAEEGGHVFIKNIVYDEIPAFRVNIFDENKMTKDSSGGTLDSKSQPLINTMLPEIQKWYGYTRVLAIAAALVMLVYVAIQILLSTAAGDKAKYKQLLKDWVLSLLLIFTMHFIMAGILYVADAVTAVFAKAGAPFDAFARLNDEIAKLNYQGLIYAMLKWVFLIITLAFVLIYTKRVIMIAFLTIVAPLIAISYSVDKIKDGKSQILDKWMKEYVYNALTMPMDALLFTLMSGVLSANLANDGNIIFAVALVVGYLPLRGWFNEFLGTDKASHGMSGAAAGAAIGSMLAMKGGKGGKGSKDSSSSSDGTGGNAEAEKEKVESGAPGSGGAGGGAGGNPVANGLPAAGNPALSGDSSEVVPEPTSAANVSSTSTSNLLGNASDGSSSPRSVAARRVLAGVGKTYGKALGSVVGLTAGVMTTAATGNVMAGVGTAKFLGSKANNGSSYGLAGNIATGAKNTAVKAGHAAQDAGMTALSAKDFAAGAIRANRDVGNLVDNYNNVVDKSADGVYDDKALQMVNTATSYIGEENLRNMDEQGAFEGMSSQERDAAIVELGAREQIKQQGGYGNYNYQNYAKPKVEARRANRQEKKTQRVAEKKGEKLQGIAERQKNRKK